MDERTYRISTGIGSQTGAGGGAGGGYHAAAAAAAAAKAAKYGNCGGELIKKKTFENSSMSPLLDVCFCKKGQAGGGTFPGGGYPGTQFVPGYGCKSKSPEWDSL